MEKDLSFLYGFDPEQSTQTRTEETTQDDFDFEEAIKFMNEFSHERKKNLFDLFNLLKRVYIVVSDETVKQMFINSYVDDEEFDVGLLEFIIEPHLRRQVLFVEKEWYDNARYVNFNSFEVL